MRKYIAIRTNTEGDINFLGISTKKNIIQGIMKDDFAQRLAQKYKTNMPFQELYDMYYRYNEHFLSENNAWLNLSNGHHINWKIIDIEERIINAMEQDGMGSVKLLTMSFALLPECTNLEEAVRKACTEYVKTEDGRKIFNNNNQCFNWGDFWICVPDRICRKHGFFKLNSVCSTEVLFDEQLVDESDVNNMDWYQLRTAIFMEDDSIIDQFLGHKHSKEKLLEELNDVWEQMPEDIFQTFYQKYVTQSIFSKSSLQKIHEFVLERNIPDPTDWHIERTEESLFNWIHDDKAESAFSIKKAPLPCTMDNVLHVEEGWIFWYV